MSEPTEVFLDEDQLKDMVIECGAKFMERKIKDAPMMLLASDSYGPILHRTWIFSVDELAVGSVERYWEGLKMICSILKGAPRTYFFTVTGERANAKDLKRK